MITICSGLMSERAYHTWSGPCLCSRVAGSGRGGRPIEQAAPGHGRALYTDAGLALTAAGLRIGCHRPGSCNEAQRLIVGCMPCLRPSLGVCLQQLTEL